MTVRLAVRLTPRGGLDRIEGWTVDEAGRRVLKARVAAPPVDGQANSALIQLIAKALGRPKSAVRIAAGDSARIKQLQIDGLDAADLERLLG
ncbi:MAG TPA: DUF167 family protein [Caulobacteraceae bacterium]|jgi:hypothetical protein